jgi:rhodanese-related sulfurtransferase
MFMLRFAVLLAMIFCSTSSQAADDTAADAERRDRVERLYARYERWTFRGAPEIDVAGLVRLQQRPNVVLVDVRAPEERAVSSIPGAISPQDFQDQEHLYAGHTVVAYCTIGVRSGKWVKKVRKRGIDARNLRGGILLWAHAGRPIEDEAGPTRKVHVYGARWDLLPAGYDGVR